MVDPVIFTVLSVVVSRIKSCSLLPDIQRNYFTGLFTGNSADKYILCTESKSRFRWILTMFYSQFIFNKLTCLFKDRKITQNSSHSYTNLFLTSRLNFPFFIIVFLLKKSKLKHSRMLSYRTFITST